MNAANKARWANILTTLSVAVVIIQTLLTNPPFTPHAIYVGGLVLTYLSLVITKWKQYLSPDVNNTGGQVTVVIAIIATVAGVLDLLQVFNIAESTSQWIKWAVTVVVTLLNVLSKQLFPSDLQKDKMKDLKYQ